MRPFLTALLVATAAALAAPLPAAAHAALKAASPAADATVPAGTADLVLTFNEPLEHRFCQVQVQRAGGEAVAVGAVQPVEGDPAAMKVPLGAPGAGLPAGRYEVSWSAMGRDGHRTKGRYAFTVK